MATWNGAAYLPEQLESLAKQELLPSELVVRDDGSTDSTLGKCSRNSRAGSPFPVHVSRNPTNLGVRSTFEEAISLCGRRLSSSCATRTITGRRRRSAGSIETFEGDPRTMVVINDKVIADEQLEPVRGDRCSATCAAPERPTSASSPAAARPTAANGCRWLCRSRRKCPIMTGGSGPSPVSSEIPEILDEPLQLYRRHGSNASVHPHY